MCSIFLEVGLHFKCKKFQGIVVLIAGGASGLGAGTARHLVKHGAKVAILDLPSSRNADLIKELGENCLFTAADVCL